MLMLVTIRQLSSWQYLQKLLVGNLFQFRQIEYKQILLLDLLLLLLALNYSLPLHILK